MASDSSQKLGIYIFLAGVAIAIVAGILFAAGQAGIFAGIETWIPLVLVLFGVVVGFLNIKDKDLHEFLMAAMVLLLLSGTAAGLNQIPAIGVYLASIAQSLAIFVAPAALIVSIKAIKDMAMN